MFDLDAGKLMVFGIVALAVIPPKDLPRVLRTVGQYVGKMRRMAAEFQGQFMDAMKEAELESVQKELTSLHESTKVDVSFDPAPAMREESLAAPEPPKTIATSSVALEPAAAAPIGESPILFDGAAAFSSEIVRPATPPEPAAPARPPSAETSPAP